MKKKNIDIKLNNKLLPKGQFDYFKYRNKKPILFSRGKTSSHFFTEDSKLYITPKEYFLMKKGVAIDRKIYKWDALSSRVVKNFERYNSKKSFLLKNKLEKRLDILNETFSDVSKNFVNKFTIVRLWNISIVASILFGMIAMTFIYRMLGQNAEAEISYVENEKVQIQQNIAYKENEKNISEIISEIENAEKAEKREKQVLETQIKEMVKGYPIEKMVPYIIEKDPKVAAFMVAIAKKESAWGKRVPVLNGADCFNYWGYRQERELMGTGGHTCFTSRKEAVDTVSKRIATLVEKYGKDTPEEMVLWKCGTGCAFDSGAKKWISDVKLYFNKFEIRG